MTEALWALDATTTARMVAAGEVSASEVLEAHLRRIDSVNPRLNAIVRRADDHARERAQEIDAGNVTGALAGAVMTTKINTDHVGFPTDNGIRALANHVPSGNHPCVTGLLDAGLVMAGRTNSPAFAMRSHTDNDLHGETLNPYDANLSCGGSSGGAGVAVATGMCHVAQGNDVAGSIRWPSLMNGVIGLRPTIGRVPTGGVNPALPRGWSATNMSTNGPLARSMADVRAAFYTMSRDNWGDPLWVPAPHEFAPSRRPVRVTLVTNDEQGFAPAVRDAVRRVGDVLASAGYDVREGLPPMTETLFGLWGRLGVLDLAHGLVPLLDQINDSGLRASITDWMRDLPPPTTEGFVKALADRDLVMRSWTTHLAESPLIVTPLLDRVRLERGEDVAAPGAMSRIVNAGRWGINLSAIEMPALAFPTGLSDGTPLGVQLISRAWREDLLLDAGDALERHFGVVRPVDVAWA